MIKKSRKIYFGECYSMAIDSGNDKLRLSINFGSDSAKQDITDAGVVITKEEVEEIIKMLKESIKDLPQPRYL